MNLQRLIQNIETYVGWAKAATNLSSLDCNLITKDNVERLPWLQYLGDRVERETPGVIT